jgi:hypothetical protein
MYDLMFNIVQSRVLSGLITDIEPSVKALYQYKYSVKPSGSTDVIERQQQVQAMMQAWPVIQNTPAAVQFLMDMLQKMFPDNAANYIQIIQQAQQQQQSQQAQQMQQGMAAVKQMASGIVNLSQHPEMFSDTGRIHALPVIQQAAQQIQQFGGQQ